MKDSAIMGRESLIGRRTVGPADEGAKSHQAGNILFGQKLLQSKLHLFGSLKVVFSTLFSNHKVEMHNRKSIYLLQIGTNWATIPILC